MAKRFLIGRCYLLLAIVVLLMGCEPGIEVGTAIQGVKGGTPNGAPFQALQTQINELKLEVALLNAEPKGGLKVVDADGTTMGPFMLIKSRYSGSTYYNNSVILKTIDNGTTFVFSLEVSGATLGSSTLVYHNSSDCTGDPLLFIFDEVDGMLTAASLDGTDIIVPEPGAVKKTYNTVSRKHEGTCYTRTPRILTLGRRLQSLKTSAFKAPFKITY